MQYAWDRLSVCRPQAGPAFPGVQIVRYKMLADAAEAHSLERPTPGSKEPMLPEIPQAPQMMADVTDDSE